MDMVVPRTGGEAETMGSSQINLADSLQEQGIPGRGQDPHTCSLGHTLISEYLPAVGTEEVLGVPGLLHGREDFLQEKPRR